MSPPPKPWFDRLFDDLPTMPRWLFPVFMLFMIPLLTFFLGLVICSTHELDKTASQSAAALRQSTSQLTLDSLQLKLETLDQRLKTLEARP